MELKGSNLNGWTWIRNLCAARTALKPRVGLIRTDSRGEAATATAATHLDLKKATPDKADGIFDGIPTKTGIKQHEIQ